MQYEAILKAKKEERRKKEQEKKDLLKAPLDPLPIRPLCEYEELREKNIKEREEAMAKSGFFVNLTSYKKEIGLVDNQLLSEAQSGKKKNIGELKKETNIKANHKKKKKDQRIITPSIKRESDKTCVDELKGLEQRARSALQF